MLVTINTDASWSPSQKGAGFAFWIVSDQGKVAKSGALKQKKRNVHLAELACIANAMACLVQQRWKGISKIIINTDSKNSIHVITNDEWRRKMYGLTGRRYDTFRDYILKIAQAPIECRHVKAHESTATKRQFVNDWCDKEAKQGLQKWHKQQLTK